MIWQSPGLPGWRKVNFITVTRRPLHPNIAAGLCCLATSPGFLPTLCEKWSGFFYVHRVFLSYTRDRRLKVSSERLGNEDKAPCPRALLPGRGSNRRPPVWKSEALTARPRQLLLLKILLNIHNFQFCGALCAQRFILRHSARSAPKMWKFSYSCPPIRKIDRRPCLLCWMLQKN